MCNSSRYFSCQRCESSQLSITQFTSSCDDKMNESRGGDGTNNANINVATKK